MPDPFDLARFVDAQSEVWRAVVAELTAGRKRSHWMWYVFPQVAGLGTSPMAQRFAISSRAEAEAYLADPVLGPRLLDCTRLVCSHRGEPLAEILGYPDDMKFASSMTLFEAVSRETLFGAALDQFCGGRRDAATLSTLQRWDART